MGHPLLKAKADLLAKIDTLLYIGNSLGLSAADTSG